MKRIAVLVAAVALAVPASAGATIVVNQGFFGVNIGDSAAQVRHTLGKPAIVNHAGKRTLWFHRRGVLITFNSNHRVVDLFTESRSERTANGVGVGSTEGDVKRLVRGVQCGTIPGVPGVDCIVADYARRVFTDFAIGPKGRVTDVLIGKV